MDRKIIHIDMDAFFASVEQRDNPELQGKPLIVGGQPQGRGVVAAASYEARRFGIRSAMSCKEAYRRCPDAIFVRPHITKYRRVSRVIMSVLREYTDLVEPLSLDEAFLDVTRNKKALRYATQVAKDARAKIKEYTGLTSSAGVAPNKFLAKIASDINKPDGMKVIRPEEVFAFLTDLPIRTVPGIGRVMEEKMLKSGVLTIGHLRRFTEEELNERFGKQASWFYRIARGIDERPVVPERERKSVGSEDTFSRDTTDISFMKEKIKEHCESVSKWLQRASRSGKTVTVKVKFADFRSITRSKTPGNELVKASDIEAVAIRLLEAAPLAGESVRLLGVSVSNLSQEEEETTPQLCLGF